MSVMAQSMPHDRVSTDRATSRDAPTEVMKRLEISDPQEDIAREQARMAESAGLQVVNNDITAMTQRSPPSSAPRRQDFSNETVSKRDTKIGDYILGQTLGEGEFGKVKMGWKPQGGVQVAIKLIRREKLDTQQRLAKVYREINILRELDHPNIVRLHEMVETEKTIGIILEYASGGELFDFILNERFLKDPSARRLFAQLVSGTGYLHKKGIVHRDLKLENLLLDRNNNIIITDFGFANTFDPNDELGDRIEARLHRKSFVKRNKLEDVGSSGFRRGDLMATSCGSPCYAAPELVISEGIYTGRKVDVWSCGVILYAMLAGYLPFDDDPANPDGDNINLLYRYISTAPLVFPEHVTPHARDLLRRILVPDPRKRADLFEVARHSWLSEYSHVVEFITSSSTLPADVSKATIGSDGQYVPPPMGRSASLRESSKPAQTVSPVGGLVSKPGKVSRSPESERSKPTPKETKRRTVQVEYLPPQTQTVRNEPKESPAPSMAQDAAVAAAQRGSPRTRVRSDAPVVVQQTLPPTTTQTSPTSTQAPPPPPKNNMPPPTRPMRDVPRSISDSTAFNMGQSQTQNRPSTQGSMNASSRLPSRGSYGQPAVATVATTNAQGRFSQPKPPSSAGYTGTGSSPQTQSTPGQTPQTPTGRFEDQRVSSETADAAKRRGHARSSTLSDLSQKIFGRSPSTRRGQEVRPRPDRSYPPTSMKRPVDSAVAPRASVESRRSFGFGRRSTDFSSDGKRSSKRFSFIPRFRGSSRDTTTPPRTTETSQSGSYSHPMDGTQETQYAFDERPPNDYQAQPNANSTWTHQSSPSYSAQPSTYTQSAPRMTSAGNPMSTQTTWSTYQSSNAQTFEGSSGTDPRLNSNQRYQFAEPTSTSAQNEKARWDSEQWSTNRRWHTAKSGPAQRVMDFFRGRRQERSNMA